jgi:hypothetical protein
MFMDNKALLDQLMGKDRNAPTFKGITEQWKDPAVCKAYLVGFCPYEILINTKISLGTCRATHSDVALAQFETSNDPQKQSLTRKYELDLLTHLERIVDNVDTRVRKQQDRIRIHNSAELRFPPEKQKEIDELNLQISVAMKQVEKLAEQGLFEDSTSLMGKVDELNSRTSDLRKEAEGRYFKHETVCMLCGAVTTYNASGEDKDELINDHLGGRQHIGMEHVRMRIIEIKNRYKLSLSRRDRDFKPSEKLQIELRREGIEIYLPHLNPYLHLNERERSRSVSEMTERGDRRVHHRSRRQFRGRSPRRTRSRSLRRERSSSTPRSMESITFE